MLQPQTNQSERVDSMRTSRAEGDSCVTPDFVARFKQLFINTGRLGKSLAPRSSRSVSFPHWAISYVVLALLISGLTGCFGGNQKKAGGTRTPGSKIDPEEITGRWKMSIANRGAQSDIGMLEIKYDAKKTEQPYSLELIGLGSEVSQLIKIKSQKIDSEGSVEFEIQGPNVVSSFVGRLDGEAIWGSFLEPHFQLVPAKMERTDLQKVEPAAPIPVSHFDDYMKALGSNDSYVALDTFAEKSNRSPLLFEAYEAMAFHLKKEKLERPAIDKFIDEYRNAVEIWGPRMAFQVDLNVGHALAANQLEPKLTKTLLEAAESKIKDDFPLEFSAKLMEGWVLLGEPELALKRLPQLLEKDPTNPGLLWLYARAKEKAKDTDEALLAYAKVMVIPGFEQEQKTPGVDLPSLSAIRLWKSKHNDKMDGFEEFALKAYDDVMKLYVPKRTPAKREAGAKVPLVEMFTGTGNTACIATDIAVESLRLSYSPQEVVVIKYHQHNPYVDPLANDSSIKRMGYYGVSETPALAFDGQVVEQSLALASASGSMAILASVRGAVESEAKLTSPVSIHLEAKREGDIIQVKADIAGIKTLEHQPRLYLVLVENDIKYPGITGILRHNCVARAFIGDLRGVALKKGDSSHTESISLSTLKSDLLTHIKQFESEREFPLKPMDFKKLQVVAFVQNSHTRIVQQSALVEVTGDIPVDPTPEPKPDTKPNPEPDTKPNPEPEAKPEAAPELDAKSKPETKPDEDPGQQPEVKTEQKPVENSEEKPAPTSSESNPTSKRRNAESERVIESRR